MVLVSLFVFVNGGCTSQGERMKLIVWEGAGEKIINVSCDVDDEEMMLEVVLQDLKGILVSNVESNIIYLRKGKEMCMSLRTCYIGPGKCEYLWTIGTLIKSCPVTHVGLKSHLCRLG